MPAKPATLAAVARLTKQIADLDAQRKKIAKRVESVRAVGGDAIKKSDLSRLGVVKTALAGDIKAVSASIDAGKACVATLGAIQQDEDFVAEKLEAIDKLAEKIDTARDAIGESFEALKDLQNEVEAKVDELTSEQSNLRIKMAGLEKDTKNLAQRIDTADTSATKIWQDAQAAFADRNAKLLKTKADELAGLGAADLQTELDEFNKEIANYQKLAASLDAKTKAFILDTIKDNAPPLEVAQKQLDTIKANLDKLKKDMAIEAIDPRKALDALELDAKWLAKLTKALGCPLAALERELGVLAKEAKSKLTGKQMVEALKKAKLI
jgi:chromosome segregation ATPase